MKPLKLNHRLLAMTVAAVSVAIASILSIHAQTIVVLDENFNRGTLGGIVDPSLPNTTDLSQVHDYPTGDAGEGYGPNFFPGDSGVVVDDLRGEVGGRALKFNDKVEGGALRVGYGLNAVEDSVEKSHMGTLSISWDFSFDKEDDELFGNDKVPLQFVLRADNGAHTSLNFLVFSSLNDNENQFHILSTNSNENFGSLGNLFDGHMFDLGDSEVYRVELNLNLGTKQYDVNLFVGSESTPSWTESGLKFVNDDGWDYFGNYVNLNFQGGGADFLEVVGGDSGLVMDNLLVTYTIPEPATQAMLLFAGCLLSFVVFRRRIKH